MNYKDLSELTKKFLDSSFSEIEKIDIDLDKFGAELDHIAWQCATSQEYDNYEADFEKLGELVREPIIGGRRVGVFKLFKPLVYDNQEIWAIELIEPTQNETPVSGLEHLEFCLNSPLEDLMSAYPELDWDTSSVNREKYPHLKLRLNKSLRVKFPRQSILSE